MRSVSVRIMMLAMGLSIGPWMSAYISSAQAALDLTLERALTLAMQHSPVLKASEHEVRIQN